MTGDSLPPAAQAARAPWWRSAVIFQIWPQSFADADGQYAVDVQLRDPSSTLQMYRAALGLRRQRQLGLGSLTWLDLGRDVVAFVVSDITVVVNLGSSTLTLPGGQVLMASLSGAVTGSRLAPDTAVWLAS